MAYAVEVTSFDPASKRYVAQLIVTEPTAEYRYTCEGTWDEKDAAMVAGALYDQHKAVLQKQGAVEAAKAAIVSAVTAEIDTLAAKG